MTLEEMKDILGAEVVVGSDCMDIEIRDAFAADLLSDVLAFAKEGTILITGITNPQVVVVRTAEMLELVGIVFVRGKKPDAETMKLAQIKKVPILSTRYIMFETCGRLFKNGLSGCVERVDDGRTNAG
jgi:predicted transcriptional regulator